ncbi:amino acid ABC transporter substrate-binding protein [Haematobacter missouriensis]|uniref:Quinoprotein dehydrogenase-associated putative ABC transporter substrate-binding protein n=1 Tax=Haematobacter missouriensis TaxID=366616 RepID=A0A212AN88_9RHOB|nr:substrate-binding domain-containing protein [Haematobacter missouriensis]KFI25196.1 amino acid ABC transporter substrate-binding protein [Haematobacter missouriensis]OWJ70696.1 quinoprotein dehydrogenase-associated putative ABC transporter substrate-binding protein [Haematobacter missouriensis]OWJ82961.1 quinoprotein dehydrogenase-associated putative ABC transporter substrate-binding protein [Haematobacter missouriensis]
MTRSIIIGLLCAAFCGAGAAGAQVADLVDRDSFRVCADPANKPLSAEDGSGFENRIAALLAERLGVPLHYTWFPQVTGFVRNTLGAGKCDVVIGFAQGDDLVLNTNHYYTSTHILVTRADSELAAVDSLFDPRLKGHRIGVVVGAPATTQIARAGLMKDAEPYALMVDRRVENPAGQMLEDVKSGKTDAAVLWGPIGGPLAKGDPALKVTPLLKDEGPPRLFYRITMGVRAGEDNWKRELNSLIRRSQSDVDAILRDAGVPILDDYGKRLKPEG